MSGGLDAGLNFFGLEGFEFQSLGKYSSVLKKFGVGMAIASGIISWGSSVYNNFTNPNYTTGEAFGASVMDAIYYTAKGFGAYWLGSKVGKFAVTAGITIGASIFLGAPVAWSAGLVVGLSIGIGGLVAIGIGFAGAVAIYYLGVLLDYGWSELKKALFE